MTYPPDAAALAEEWDERYTSLAERIPDGTPSAVLIETAGNLRPGTALDVGCGVGSDAIWLAAQGWKATALDVSQVALNRAAERGRRAGVDVNWVCSRLEDLPLPPAGFDLVTAHYPALLHSPDADAERALLAAVAPGGTLLVVHHADIDVDSAKAHGFDPADYLSHDDVIELLCEEWEVSVQKRRLRVVPAGIDGQHTHDDIVLARRH
ncbi:class I SAM-dependent methyltransferase [Mycolicibacterium austroafricanum]|uniref:class I SAM-dependent methyltransferase n=1 Tax=Mycolicibacterium austroafricanum TaxID=39687 RepID=UPI00055FF0E7|nr:class I SAM-dependent methyltransferase [Mycolicibacterium austroafricanum]QZY45621.1 class I SAM-dependent methyltransferase [Mycolicibacterium austroafricanum]